MWDKEVSSAFAGTSLAVRCYESHPVLKFGKGKLYGGSASNPKVKDADVYVALQSGSTCGRSSDPWETQKVVEIHYTIRDMDAPVDVPRFKKLVTWLCNQLQDEKRIHVGCVGGHGRTGTVLTAIVAELLGKKDAIQYVRKHYCEKAVESKSQIAFLMKHYGVSEAAPTKQVKTEWSGVAGWAKKGNGGDYTSKESSKASESKWTPPETTSIKLVPEGVSVRTKSFDPMASARSLWKLKKRKK